LIESDKECINYYSKKYLALEELEKVSKLKDEIMYLSELLPKNISTEEIKTIIDSDIQLKTKIIESENKSKIIGEIVKYFKEKNINANSKDIYNIVKNY